MSGSGRVMAGGANLYGYRVGILMIEGRFPRPPGAIGNARSFDFPVLHRVVPGASGEVTVRMASQLSAGSQRLAGLAAPWIEGAKELERQGCLAITTSCGFAILYQQMLAEAVSIPVWSSSLLLAPFILSGLPASRRLGIITAEASALGPSHFALAGVDPARCAMIGMEGCPEFAATAWQDRTTLDVDRQEEEAVSVARRLAAQTPDLGAILLECSLLPPYAAMIQKAVPVPVFDFTHLVRLAHDTARRQPFIPE
ncbi:aspartate/glutamate racemase family protein [Paracoccus onubensis]|uniref:aspartate/glutamate racemase family protein n=1 Tax=Paracoccus onubensis TaxID=1675788 RepID=UPI0027321400|nr:aspartate/glutamate racemase family protein [Paracoccus onubensis]MDP0926933.1 aspartate/glutamate racemase family protein [Paracoccus onubensis]